MSGVDESCHQFSLLANCLLANGRELVVTTPGVMRGTGVVHFRLTDQLVGDKSGQSAVQRPGPQPNLSVSELIDEPHHGVPVAVTGGQREQDLEAGRR